MSDIDIIVPTASPVIEIITPTTSTVEIVAGDAVSVADIVGSSALGQAILSAATAAAVIALLGGSVTSLDDYLSAGGAVDSVNGQVGTVVLDADDIDDSATTNKFVTLAEIANWNTAFGWGNHAAAGYATTVYVDAAVAASSGTPGGADTQVQFNDGGAFGGDSALTWNKTTNRLAVGGTFAHGGGTLFDPFGGSRTNFTSVSTAAAATQNYQNDYGARFQITAPNAYLFESPYYYGAGMVAYIPTTRQTGGLPSVYGIYAQGINRSPYPVDQVNGFYGYAYHMGAGTCAYLGGIQFGVYAVNDWYPDGLGAPAVGNVTTMVIVDTSNWIQANVTNYYGVRLYYPDLASGKTITNCYGYYVQNHSGTGITNGWNIYSEGATSRNYFGGSVGIGTATPTVPLDVKGRTNVAIGTPLNFFSVNNAAISATWQGNLTAGGRDAAIVAEIAGTETSGNTDMNGLHVTAYAVAGAINYAQGASIILQNRSSSTVTNMYGIYGEALHAGTGNVGYIAGLQYSVGSENYGFGAPGVIGEAYGAVISNYFESNVTTFYGIYLRGVGLASGKTITNAYGLRVGNHSVTGVTNGWNIYSEGATSRNLFEGFVGIGRPVSASAQLALAAATTAKASLNIAAGVAPAAPLDGDIWWDGTDVLMRIGGVTKKFTLV